MSNSNGLTNPSPIGSSERQERHGSRRSAAVNEGPKTLQPLPWPEIALAPVISARTVRLHYGKHHRGYLDKLNALIRDTELADLSIEEIVKATAEDPHRIDIYNNAAQVWNHDFYWRCLKPQGGGRPHGPLLAAIERQFESFEEMRAQLVKAAVGQFGSGWAWLVQDGERLRILTTSNADSPLAMNVNPLLTIDVWEHAYYLDYHNRREDHVKAIIERLVNWEFVSGNLQRMGS